jgi:hypothetical protein
MVVLAAIATLVAAGVASARQDRKSRPAQRPHVIIKDRWLYGPPPPPSSERNYYGPAPGIQQPMQRAPLPAPLAQPPINR